jgi:hypothetical protein
MNNDIDDNNKKEMIIQKCLSIWTLLFLKSLLKNSGANNKSSNETKMGKRSQGPSAKTPVQGETKIKNKKITLYNFRRAIT